MLRTVVFDLGNVLLQFSHERMCRQIGDVCGAPWKDVWQWLFDEHWERDFERGDIAPDVFQQRIEQRVGHPVDEARLRLAASDIFTLNEPIVPVVDALKSLGMRLVLLSNTHIWHVEFVRQRFDILDRFDELVLSYEVGAVKPEPAIFDAVLRVLHCTPSDAFYTDDIAKYVEIGRQRGLNAETFTNVPALKQQLAARSAFDGHTEGT
jgi:putative hydrolase of the HAD superfamily